MSESNNSTQATAVSDSTPITVAIVQSPVENLENPIKSVIYSRAKVVKYLTIIDIFFLLANFIISIILGNFFWLFFIFIPMCYSGYKGAENFKKEYLCGYIIYLFIMTVFYMFLAFFYNNLFIMLVFLVEVYILYYTAKLYNYLKQCPEHVLESLRDNWSPDNLMYYYY